MKIDDLLNQKALEFAHKECGWCDELRETPKESWRYFLGIHCNQCDKRIDDGCDIYNCATWFKDGCCYMFHRVKPIILQKVMIDLLNGSSPYMEDISLVDDVII